MDIMEHGHYFFPAALIAGARAPGGADHPHAVDETFPPLPPATGIRVGVIDTGIALNEAGEAHSWFGDHVSFTEQDTDPLKEGHYDRYEAGYLADADGHGTFVTGLILSEAPTARVTMCGVLDKGGDALRRNGLEQRDDAEVAKALSRLADDPEVQVINLSFAGGVFPNVPSSVQEVLSSLPGRLAVVAAAGNGRSVDGEDVGTEDPVWPATFEKVISVGALDEQVLIHPGATPQRARFSNYGKWVDAYASGVHVLGPFVYYKENARPDPDGTRGLTPGHRWPQSFTGWARWSGTSFAAALVSGRIAQTAIERGITGAEAAQVVLCGSQKIFNDHTVWVRGAGLPALRQDRP
jgi:hypothetical protein